MAPAQGGGPASRPQATAAQLSSQPRPARSGATSLGRTAGRRLLRRRKPGHKTTRPMPQPDQIDRRAPSAWPRSPGSGTGEKKHQASTTLAPRSPARAGADPRRRRPDPALRSTDPTRWPGSSPENHQERVWMWRSGREVGVEGTKWLRRAPLFRPLRAAAAAHRRAATAAGGKTGGGGPSGAEVVAPVSPLGSAGGRSGLGVTSERISPLSIQSEYLYSLFLRIRVRARPVCH
jgi:hypothetical protein